MTSAIDPTVPVFGSPTTASVRNNFAVAASEISTLQSQIASGGGVAGVSSFNTRTGAVALNLGDVTSALGFSPAPTVSPNFSGVPQAPTANPGTNTIQLATTAFVAAAVIAGTAGVASFNTRTGAVTLSSADVTNALTFAPYNATNPAGYQTAAQVTALLVPYAPLASPSLTGTPLSITPPASDNTTKIATTAFVAANLATRPLSTGAPALNNVLGWNGSTWLPVPAAGGTGVDTVTPAITATPGAVQGSGLLTNQFNEVTTCVSGAGVTLPAFMSTPGQKCRVASYGANPLLVFPQTGQTFFSAGVSNGLNAALTIQIGAVVEFESATATTVYTVP
jgi:hypothetical protein